MPRMHPIHPMFKDSALALCASSVLWDALAVKQGAPIWWSISFGCECIGLVVILPIALAGLLDLLLVNDGVSANDGSGRMALMLLATAAFLLSVFARGGSGPCSGVHRTLAVGTAILGFVCLGIAHGLGKPAPSLRRPAGRPREYPPSS